MSKDHVSFNVKGYIDRRTLDLHQRHDVIEERRFNWRVERRAAQPRRQIPLVSRLEDMGTPQPASSRQGGNRPVALGSRSAASGQHAFTLVCVRDLPERGPASVGLE